MRNEPPFVLFSAERADMSEMANRDRTAMMAGALSHRNIDWHRVDGVYNGHPEAAFLVWTYEGSPVADQIESLARLYGQESILYVDAQRLAYLLMLKEERTVEIGAWREIPDFATGGLNYTQVNGKIYAAF